MNLLLLLLLYHLDLNLGEIKTSDGWEGVQAL